MGEQFCEIILNLDNLFRKCHFKVFLIWSSGSPSVQQSITFCAILVEGIMRNNSVNLFYIWASGSKDFLSGALVALLFGGAEPFM